MSNKALIPLDDYVAACDAIREKTGTTDLIKSGEMAEKIMSISAGGDGSYDEGFEAGKQAEYNEFWDVYQENGNRTVYVQAFARQGWKNDTTYRPKYDIVGGTFGLQETFTNASQLKDTKVNLIVRSDGLTTTFNGCTQLVRIPSLILEVPVTKMSLAFNNCHNLEELNITCVGDGCISENGLTLQWSKKLTIESLRSIINALADKSADTSGTVWKVTVGSENYAKLTEEDLENIDKKGWVFQ